MNKRKEEKKKKKKERENRENGSILYRSCSTDPSSLINKTKLRKKLISSNYIVSQLSLLSILSKTPADHFFFFFYIFIFGMDTKELKNTYRIIQSKLTSCQNEKRNIISKVSFNKERIALNNLTRFHSRKQQKERCCKNHSMYYKTILLMH